MGQVAASTELVCCAMTTMTHAVKHACAPDVLQNMTRAHIETCHVQLTSEHSIGIGYT
jgi:hypothetical protein